VSSLHAVLRPFLLRRLKADVALDIPDKREIILYTGKYILQHFSVDPLR
jgi:ATP-dependent DNA helicase